MLINEEIKKKIFRINDKLFVRLINKNSHWVQPEWISRSIEI